MKCPAGLPPHALVSARLLAGNADGLAADFPSLALNVTSAILTGTDEFAYCRPAGAHVREVWCRLIVSVVAGIPTSRQGMHFALPPSFQHTFLLEVSRTHLGQKGPTRPPRAERDNNQSRTSKETLRMDTVALRADARAEALMGLQNWSGSAVASLNTSSVSLVYSRPNRSWGV